MDVNNSQQEQTITNNSRQENERVLNEKQVLAIKLKYEGISYREISNKTGVPYDTLGGWFKIGGILFEKYIEYAQGQSDALKQESHVLLERGVWNAVAVINQALTEKVNTKAICPKCGEQHIVEISLPMGSRLKAAIEVVDRVFGKSEQSINLKGTVGVREYGNLSDEQLAERLADTEKEINGGKSEEVGGENTL
jgi:hypothetical protein